MNAWSIEGSRDRMSPGRTPPHGVETTPEQGPTTLAAELDPLLVQRAWLAVDNPVPVELVNAVNRVFEPTEDLLLVDNDQHWMVDRCRSVQAFLEGPADELCNAVIDNRHPSIALVYADMLAKALVVHGPLDRKVVVTVGGTALGGPMGRLALLRIGAAAQGVVVVVFDDLGRSDAPADGELPAHLADLRQRGHEDRWGEPFAFVPDNLFEPLGLTYLGPIDGHDVDAMEYALRLAGWLGKPVLVHCVTRQPAARAKDVASKPTGSFLPTVPPVRSRLSPQLRQQRAVQRHRLLQPTASQATHPAPRRIGRRVP